MSVLSGYIGGLPRIGSRQNAAHRTVFRSGQIAGELAGGRVISGGASRDPGNTGNVDVLRAGLLMGKIASPVNSLGAAGQYAPSVIGVSGGSLSGTATTLTIDAGTSTELARRVGASGAFNLTGPAAANGAARTLTATYSALGSTSATISALGVNEVQTVAVNTILSGGGIGIRAVDLNGVEQEVQVAYSTSWTNTVSLIQTALNGVLGTSAVACAVTNTHDMTITFSGTGYAGLPQTPVRVDISAATGPTTVTVTRTTAGVNGAFVSGSLIQPTDGSQTPVTVIPDGWGVKVTDIDGVTNLDQPFAPFPVAGIIQAAQLLPAWPSDTGIQAYLINALKATGLWVADSAF